VIPSEYTVFNEHTISLNLG